ncbi:pre-rRNA-processing protein esf1 [Purpureocillium takamizusanense]|uniref:Pre-rRNA-processing protein esf1 n=1 Tax=Purpureocillium takamizusanense TaxID=2060973 RepID=A0A9Q8QBX7_9HYPO|nr:pre-rRNA-processing protein esf1 [Purpureocillium takamizusanense]UNI16785.1 pre-rRNA-processing protein esf1 [Purpureocillium takamizusanense]
MKGQKKDAASSAGRIADARFASFETDPRFRLPSKKRTKTTLDKRFAGMLNDDDFTATARVDRYGRKVKSDAKKKALQRLYQAEDDQDKDHDSQNSEDDDDEVDDDELVQRELREAHEKSNLKKHDPARDGGFSSSESDADSDDSDADSDDSDEEDEEAAVETEGDMQRFQDDQAEVESGEVTNRIAIVNLDWDHVKSTDLMALFSSFIPPNSGRILNISVYPSEFGKERMQQEELEGPPKELFKNEAKDEDDSSDEDDSGSDDSDSESADERIKKELMKEGNDQDFDSDALRSYQLDRLRYYYAVMVCSSPETAQLIYEATDGTEYQSSSNFIDLRFIPDDVTFDDEPRDVCDKVPSTYKPVDFVTNALQSSKVKLTWDMHPEEASRKDALKRAFSGSRAELEENDLRAYLASDTEDDDEVDEAAECGGEDAAAAAAAEPKLSKKELARKKMREALGLTDEPTTKASKDGPIGEMEITFAPALAESKAKSSEQEETTIEKYKRKEKERKERKRQAAKAKRTDHEDDVEEPKVDRVETGDDLGFDDPFFTTEDAAPVSKSSVRKEERLKKRQAREAAEAESAQQKAQLSKVMAEGGDGDQADHLDHFDMNEIMRAEKKKSKKGKKGKSKGGDERGGLQEDFAMDVGDDRFKAVFDSHEFAIDPSNPKFKATGGMKQLLEEGRKKRKAGGDGDERGSKKSKKNRR